jgi:phosphatidylglycerophosphate synthase
MTAAGSRPTAGSRLRAIPNALTVARIGLAVGFPWIPEDERIPALLIALVTEFLDGYLARRFGWTSEAGQLLDPIADKLLFAVVVGTFLAEHRMTWLQLAAIGVRDVAVILGAFWLAVRGTWRGFGSMRPGLSGKATTALQYAAFFVVAFGYRLPWPLVAATFVAGFAAALQYGLQFRREARSA